MLELIKDNLLLILILLFFLLMAARGYNRGLLHTVASFAGLAISLFIAKTLMPEISERLGQNNSWVSFVTTKILPKLPAVSLEQVMAGISFLIVFVITIVIVGILVSALGKLKEIELFGYLDRTLGAALGLAEALVFVWVFMLFVDIMPQLALCEEAAVQIAADPFLSLLHDKNLLLTAIRTGTGILMK